ncbi:MarR family winged helix-turn-helix transcriptional regulator [Chloroflexota bacterium]
MDRSREIGLGLWSLLNRTRQLIYKARKKELSQYGTTTRRAAILSIVMRLGGKATQPEIARQLFTGRHVISEQLTRMEKEGIINRFRDPNRKNEVNVRITEKGNQLFESIVICQSILDTVSILTEEESLVLWRILLKLRDRGITNLGFKPENLTLYPPSDPPEQRQ